MESLVYSANYFDNMLEKSEHYHDVHQLIFVSQGDADFKINDSLYSVGAGSLIIASRFENHSLHIRSNVYRRYDIKISPYGFEQQEEEMKNLLSVLVDRPTDFSHVIKVSKQSDRLTAILDWLCADTAAEDNTEQTNLLLHMLLMIVRKNCPNNFYDYDPRFEMIGAIKHAFENDCAREYSLEDLSAHYHISSSYLSHTFKASTGCSLMSYLTSCRLAFAKSLLAKTSLTISEIVARCGFSDASNFSRTFRQRVGITPKEFRIQYQRNV